MATNNRDPKITLKAEDNTAKAFKSAQHNLRNLASSVAVLQGPLGPIAGRISAIGAAIGRMNPIVFTAGVGLTSLAFAAKNSLTVYSDYEQQMAKIEGVLRATGNTAGLSADAIDQLAFSVAKDTLASQEGARNAAAALATYGNIAGDTFKKVLRYAQDYTAIFGGNMVRAAAKLGRAFDDPKRGLESLAEKMTVFDDATRQMIVSMQQSGDLMGAQAEIAKILDDTIGGAGEGQGLAFSVDTLGENWDRFLIAMAKTSGAGEAATSFMDTLALGLERVTEFLDPSTARQLAEVNYELTKLYESQQRVAEQPGGVDSSLFEQLGVKIKEAQIERDALTAAMREQREEEEALARAAKAEQVAREAKKRAYANEKRALEQLRALMKEGSKLTLQMRDADTVYADEVTRLNRLLEAKAISAQTYNAAITAAEKTRDRAKKTPGMGEVDRFLAPDQEEKLKAALGRRKAIVVDALAKLKSTEVEAKEELYAKLRALDERYTQDLNRLHLQQGAGIAQSLASVLSSMASIQQTQSRSQLDRVNEDAQRRAEIVKDQLDRGVLSEAEANAKLKKIEADRVKANEANAKKTFEQAKKLQLAAAVVNTAAAVTVALATPGNIYSNFATAIAAAAAGAAQIAAIQATSFEGGGSIPGVGGATGNTPGQLPQLPGEERGSVTIQFVGDMYGWDDYMQEKVIEGIRDAVDNRDVTIIGRSSRQYQELQP